MPAEPKLSAALLDFARPLLELAPDDASPDQWTPALNIAVLVWNSVALEAVGRPNDYLSKARATIMADTPDIERDFWLAILADMEERKRGEQPLDTRLIGEFQFVTAPDGGWTFSPGSRVVARNLQTSPVNITYNLFGYLTDL